MADTVQTIWTASLTAATTWAMLQAVHAYVRWRRTRSRLRHKLRAWERGQNLTVMAEVVFGLQRECGEDDTSLLARCLVKLDEMPP